MKRANRSIAIAVAAAIAAAIAAGLCVAVVSAIVLAVVDIYLSGHSLPMLSRPWIDSGPVQLSRADSLMLGLSTVSALSAAVAVYRVRRRS